MERQERGKQGKEYGGRFTGENDAKRRGGETKGMWSLTETEERETDQLSMRC